jgi:FkbM family methyltransferase
MNPNNKIRKLIRRLGFDIVRYGNGHGEEEIGIDPFADMRRYLPEVSSPLIFDVGANVGQSIDRFNRAFLSPIIHSFEPSPPTFTVLSSNFGNCGNVKLWNFGVGSSDGKLTFHENESPVMSSFLEPDSACWGKVSRSTEIEVITLDSFARNNAISSIDILKSDTQGFDLEVFRGADHLFTKGAIKLVYFEFIFSNMYHGIPNFHEIFEYLTSHNYKLVSFYEKFHQNDILGWSDFLFVHDKLVRSK